MSGLNQRFASIATNTRETSVKVELNIDGNGTSTINTGIGFYDHLLTSFAFHSGIALSVSCEGDLHVDDHHTVEDVALAIGRAIDAALGDRKAIARFGSAYAPLDEALARTVVDLSGRPYARVSLALEREMIGTLACENISHALQSLAMAGRLTLHVDVIEGSNDHHRAEAAFKSCALAFKAAVALTQRQAVPSTKGVL